MVEGAFCYHCVHSWPHGGLVLSPFTQGVTAGNLCSGGILFTGNHFKRVGDAMSACNIRFVITSHSLLHSEEVPLASDQQSLPCSAEGSTSIIEMTASGAC